MIGSSIHAGDIFVYVHFDRPQAEPGPDLGDRRSGHPRSPRRGSLGRVGLADTVPVVDHDLDRVSVGGDPSWKRPKAPPRYMYSTLGDLVRVFHTRIRFSFLSGQVFRYRAKLRPAFLGASILSFWGRTVSGLCLP